MGSILVYLHCGTVSVLRPDFRFGNDRVRKLRVYTNEGSTIFHKKRLKISYLAFLLLVSLVGMVLLMANLVLLVAILVLLVAILILLMVILVLLVAILVLLVANLSLLLVM